MFTAGQVGIDPATGEMAGDTIEEQTKQVLDNITAVLGAAGATLADVVKVTAFLTDMSLFAGYDAVYRTYFPEPRPARSSVGAELAGISSSRSRRWRWCRTEVRGRSRRWAHGLRRCQTITR